MIHWSCPVNHLSYAVEIVEIFCGEKPLDVVFLDYADLENEHAIVFWNAMFLNSRATNAIHGIKNYKGSG
jgi:hypothetical protein